MDIDIIYNENCIEVLKRLEDNSIDAIAKEMITPLKCDVGTLDFSLRKHTEIFTGIGKARNRKWELVSLLKAKPTPPDLTPPEPFYPEVATF